MKLNLLFANSLPASCFRSIQGSGGGEMEETILNFHDDIEEAFKPLGELTNYDKKIMGEFMYMYHDDEENYFYKHRDTRKYMQVKAPKKVKFSCYHCGSSIGVGLRCEKGCGDRD